MILSGLSEVQSATDFFSFCAFIVSARLNFRIIVGTKYRYVARLFMNMIDAALNQAVANPTLRHATIMLTMDNKADTGEIRGQNLSAAFCPELSKF